MAKIFSWRKFPPIRYFTDPCRYEKQRVLIRTGHLSQFTYLLFSGSVFVNIEENDSENGKKYYRTAAVLGKGTVFGVGFLNYVILHIRKDA